VVVVGKDTIFGGVCVLPEKRTKKTIY